ncbi:MAG: AI-2E family transporter [Siphonobacter sp.]
MKTISLPFLQKLALVVFCLIGLGYLAIIGHSLLSPLLFSFLMSLLLLPVANFLERRVHFKRSLASIVSVVLMLVLMVSLVYFLINQLSALWEDWPLLKQQVMTSFHDLQHWISTRFNVNTHRQIAYLNESTEKALSTSAVVVATTLATLSSTFLFFLFTLLFTFFTLNYRRILFKFLTSVFEEESKAKVVEIVSQVQIIVKKYILGLFLQMAIVSGLFIAVLSILEIKYAVLLGLIAGIFNVVPYLGIFTALLISVLITFATAGAGKVLLVIICFMGIHAIDGNILMPLVVGSKVKINPLISFIGIIVGEMLWGISGMFLCIPYLAIMKIVFDRIDELKPWGMLMGDEEKPIRKKRVYQITRKIRLEEQD